MANQDVNIDFQEPISGDDQEKVKKLEDLYKVCDSARKPHERQWHVNILALAGNHYEAAAADTRRFDRTIPVHVHNAGDMVCVDAAYVLARQAAASIVDALDQPKSIAIHPDPRALRGAELGTDLLSQWDYELNVRDMRMYQTLWTMCCGLCWDYERWDMDAAAADMTGQSVAGLGNLAPLTLDPFKVHLPPYSDCMTEPPWIIISDCRTTDYINDVFKSSKPVKAEDVTSPMQGLDGLRNSIIYDSMPRTGVNRKNAAILKCLHRAPDRKHPKGAKVWWANGEYLGTTELPQAEMQTIRMMWFPVPAALYPKAFMSGLVNLERQMNFLLTRCAALVEAQLRLDKKVRGTAPPTEKWATGEETPPWQMFTDPLTRAKTIYYDATVQDVEIIQYAANLSGGQAVGQDMWSWMQQAAGIRDPSLGVNPPGADTATAVLAMKDSDASGLALFKNGFNKAIERIGRRRIILEREQVIIPRPVHKQGQPDVEPRLFVGEDLRGAENVRVVTTPMLTQAQIAQLKAEAGPLYGPYIDATGNPNPLVMWASLTQLLNSPIPNARDEVERILGPDMTYEQLSQACQQIYADRLKAGLVQSAAQLKKTVDEVTQAIEPQPEQSGMVPQGAPTGYPGGQTNVVPQ